MKKNKLVSLLLILCMLLSLLPASVLGEPEIFSGPYGGGVKDILGANDTYSNEAIITSTLDLTALTSNVDCGSATTENPAGSGHVHESGQPCWAWYTNGTTVDGKTYSGKVLVLNGLNITCSTDTIGLRLPDDTTIVTVQSSINTVKAADNDYGDSYGIFGEGSLIFDGKGTLNATGGAANNGKSIGIYARNGVQIKGGTVNATGATLSDVGEDEFCLVSFDSAGGTAIPAQEVVKGGTLSSLPVPAKDEAVFTGWYTEDNSENPVGPDTEFTSDITLQARYENLSGNELEYRDTLGWEQRPVPMYGCPAISSTRLPP